MEAWQTELIAKRERLAAEYRQLIELGKDDPPSHASLICDEKNATLRLYDAVDKRLQVALTDESIQKLGFERNEAGQWQFNLSEVNTIVWIGGTLFKICDEKGASIEARFLDAIELHKFSQAWPRRMRYFEFDEEPHKCLLSSSS